MKKLFILYILFIYQVSFSQELPQVVPLSPEASSLFKFMEVPVSLYGGTQNTSIPLIEINTGGLSIPLSLSYNSRGVQVSEVAPRVGNGWTLNYGGMISRQIRGIADEAYGGYHYNTNSTPVYYSDESTRYEMRVTEENSVDEGTFDYYPDKYMISTNFFSGEFYRDKNNSQIITQKFSDIKFGGNSSGDFGVIDNMGNTYSFGGVGTDNTYTNEFDQVIQSVSVPDIGSPTFNYSGSPISYNTWNLKKIVTPNKQVVEYIYEDDIATIFRRTGDVEHIYSGNYQSGSATVSCNYSKSLSHQKVLKTILYNQGRVEFIKSTDERQDLAGGHALDRIEQYNLKNELIKTIKFNYVYNIGFEDNNINPYLKQVDITATKRLFLESVVFKDLLSNKEEKYSFEYDDQPLPSRHSNSIDSWGYYNGKNRGWWLKFEDVAGNSSVNPTKMQAGLLKKITYPTGGSSVFEYEPNILNNDLPSNLKITNPNPSISHAITLSVIEPEFYNVNTHQYEKPFTVSNIMGNNATTSVSLSNSEDFVCTLKNNDTGQVTFLSLGVNPYFSIGNGSYTLIVKPNDHNWNPYPNTPNPTDFLIHNFNVSLSYINSEYDYNEIIYGPGNRIKKITTFSADDKEEFSRFYEYKNDNNESNGYLLSVSNFMVHHPNYSSNSNVYQHTPNLTGGLFSSNMKDEFGYTNVKEYFIDSTNNINEKTSHFYSIIPDLASYYKFPLHPVSDNEWLRGKELLTILYKKENNIFKPIKQIENDYLLFGTIHINYPGYPFLSNPENYFPVGYVEAEMLEGQDIVPYPYVRNRTSFCYPYSTSCLFYTNNTASYGYRTSFFTGGTFDLHTSKVTDYYDNNTFVENITTYDYDYDHHYNVAKTSTTNSIGETVESRYFYASDPEMANKPFVNSLIADNMVGMPLVTQTYKNSNKLAEQETVYKDWDNGSGVFLAPELIKTAKGDNDSEVRIRYNKIDVSNGNPLEVQQENGTKICYLWGYNKTQPVAKIENIAYDNIPSNLISDIQYYSYTQTEADILQALQALRDSPALANAMITTYTYIPSVGVSTITDPKGNTIRYHYDGFNRLEYVTDKDGNRLSENKYHYRTQN